MDVEKLHVTTSLWVIQFKINKIMTSYWNEQTCKTFQRYLCGIKYDLYA